MAIVLPPEETTCGIMDNGVACFARLDWDIGMFDEGGGNQDSRTRRELDD